MLALKLPTAPKLRGIRPTKLLATTLPTNKTIIVRDPEIVVYPPFNSTWEVWLNDWLLRRDPYWTPQVWFGQPYAFGSTRADWAHYGKQIALYLDSPVHALRGRTQQDTLQREIVGSQGWRVVAWWANSLQHLRESIARWYARDIE